MTGPDEAPPPSPDDPFEPIVESLLKYDPGSPEFEDAARVAGPAELAEAQRQMKQELRWSREAQDKIRALPVDLADERALRYHELRRRH